MGLLTLYKVNLPSRAPLLPQHKEVGSQRRKKKAMERLRQRLLLLLLLLRHSNSILCTLYLTESIIISKCVN